MAYGEPFDFSHLLPFSEVGNGDCYCFDYNRLGADGEAPVVIWRHDNGATENRAESFVEFVEKGIAGNFRFD